MFRPTILGLMKTVKRTLKVRVKNKHSKVLNKMAIEVNQVWNYCGDLNRHYYYQTKKFFSAFDFNYYLKGWSKTDSELIGSSTIQETAAVLAKSTFQFKKPSKFRKSFGKRRALGWVPFKSKATRFKDNRVFFCGHKFQVWDSYGLGSYEFKSGAFVEDSKGNWFFVVVVEVPVSNEASIKDTVGIDLGLKSCAVTSDGDVLDSRVYRDHEAELAKAQRAGKKKQVKNIHAKISNKRKDAQHKFSRKLVDTYKSIIVGNVSSKAMAQKSKGFAKSVNDASWGQLKTMLSYKCQQAGKDFQIVDEAYTTQTCSKCKSISGPKGLKGLRVRRWKCTNCGADHDRDINSAKNIAGVGHGPQVVGITSLK